MNTGLVNTQSASNWKAHPMWEYLLLVNPDAPVKEQVNVEKKYFYGEYKEKIAIATNPHVIVANFFAKEEMEDTLIRWIQRVCNNHPRFITTLNNFSGFPPHTIYLRVQNHQPYKELANGLKVINQYVRSNNCPPMHIVTTPHITIARSLSQPIYEEAIKDFSSRLFHASFRVDQLVLVKRRHPYDECKHVNIYPLAFQPNNLFN